VTAAVDRLHPAVVHHLVNTLEWRSLRPLQELAVGPILDGRHVLLGAPTAGGKAEAAVLPLLSRMTAERWVGLTVLYLCPLRALINDLGPRIARYCELLGRSAGVWHGDVGDSQRRRMLADPPDVLLTTPESLEAMALSTRVDTRIFLRGVRAVVVDEVHAFAAADRGWHLVAMLTRLRALTGRTIQTLGLTATVGNPQALLDWLLSDDDGAREVVTTDEGGGAVPELAVDFVGSAGNAARVIAGLHRGEKRLVFADSRARVEEVAHALRGLGVETYVSHSSLSADERRQAERAFAERRDCVIVATSTLELGIDVGDLDRVIQVGAPTTVASVLQRVGRTGRRPGTVRNGLFLATSDTELLQALGLLDLAAERWVEPLEPPAWPAHLAAQQLLARVLADGRVGSSTWPGAFGPVAARAGLDPATLASIVEAMAARQILVEEHGVLAIGPEGERVYGRRHFMDVTSLFLSEPLLGVRWGQRDLGQIDPSALLARDGDRPVILLGGVAWAVGDIDWERRVVWVQPTEEPGRSRWSGAGNALTIELCHAMRRVLAGASPAGTLSRRATARLDQLRDAHFWARDGQTTLVADAERERTRWWTFGGGRATATIAAHLDGHGVRSTGTDDVAISLAGRIGAEQLKAAVAERVVADDGSLVDPKQAEALKFSACLPPAVAARVVARRAADPAAVAMVLFEPVFTAG
jgi:ATP-dependent Lhr-like helicase